MPQSRPMRRVLAALAMAVARRIAHANNNVTDEEEIKRMWQCSLTSSIWPTFAEYGQWYCESLIPVQLHESLQLVDPSVPPLRISHFCNLPLNVNYANREPTRDLCHRYCELYSTGLQSFCNSCELLESGELAYDCANLFPDVECPQRDASGACQEHAFWQCQSVVDNPTFNTYGDYLCFTNSYQAKGLHASVPPGLVPWYFCDETNFTTPSLESCNSRCYLHSPTTGLGCQSCTLLESGEFAYDCSNLYPNIECPQRNVFGDCQEHFHWHCIDNAARGRQGYYCRAEFRNPIFSPAQDQGVLTLDCTNDISGKTIMDCDNPYCTILTLQNETTRCSSCGVLPNGQITYDCLNAYPNISCPVQLPNGTCTNTSDALDSVNNIVDAYLKSFPESESILERASEPVSQDQSSGDSKWSWTLKSVNPTTFNVVSDLVGYVTRFAVGIAIAALYPLWMTWRLKNGTPVPLSEVGELPGDFLSAVGRMARWSLPGGGIVLLLCFADFAHSVADTGLDFVFSTQAGPEEHVLIIANEKRNPLRPYQTAGEPVLARTTAEVSINNLTVYEQVAGGKSYMAKLIQSQTKLLESYMSAVTLIAAEGPLSPFVLENENAETILSSIGNVSGFIVQFVPGDDPFKELLDEIPMDCASTELATFQQRFQPDFYFKGPLFVESAVPNCTYSGVRGSGVYGSSRGSAKILETATLPGTSTFDSIFDVHLTKNGTVIPGSFQVTQEDKLLARDRQDWRKGRRFTAVDGVSIGTTEVKFGTAVVASGESFNGGERGYGLIAEITGECPPRASGLSSEDTECLALVNLICNTFSEDEANFYDPHYSPKETSECRPDFLGLVWGRDFVIDDELVAVAAGMYGIVRPTSFSQQAILFPANGLLAGLFALGRVETRRSNLDVVVPEVNTTYIAFMLLPIGLCFAIPLVLYMLPDYIMAVPQSLFDFMVLAREGEPSLILERPHKRGPFVFDDQVVDDDTLALVFFDCFQEIPGDDPRGDFALVELTPPCYRQTIDNPVCVEQNSETSLHGDEFAHE